MERVLKGERKYKAAEQEGISRQFLNKYIQDLVKNGTWQQLVEAKGKEAESEENEAESEGQEAAAAKQAQGAVDTCCW